MPEIFNDPEFEQYRVLEIEEGVRALGELLQDENPERFTGAMDMLKRIINLPIKMVPANNESQKEQAKMLKARAFSVFEVRMMRRFLEEG